MCRPYLVPEQGCVGPYLTCYDLILFLSLFFSPVCYLDGDTVHYTSQIHSALYRHTRRESLGDQGCVPTLPRAGHK